MRIIDLLMDIGATRNTENNIPPCSPKSAVRWFLVRVLIEVLLVLHIINTCSLPKIIFCKGRSAYVARYTCLLKGRHVIYTKEMKLHESL